MKGNTYDNVFKTLVKELPELLIPLINEMFHEDYSGKEEIQVLSENEPEMADNDVDMKVSDSNIVVVGKDRKKYHIECQSTDDDTMGIRMFRYGIREALREAELNSRGRLCVDMPRQAVIYLRHSSSTPDYLPVEVSVDMEKLRYGIKVLKLGEYTVDEIFEKKFLFLLPFIFFIYEKDFPEYNVDKEKLVGFKRMLEDVLERLPDACGCFHRPGYIEDEIRQLMKIVGKRLTNKYEKIWKEVGGMYGRVIETPASISFHEGEKAGIAQGIAQGRTQGFNDGRSDAIEKNIVSVMESLGCSRERAKEILNVE